jgi:hypothetical protein
MKDEKTHIQIGLRVTSELYKKLKKLTLAESDKQNKVLTIPDFIRMILEKLEN